MALSTAGSVSSESRIPELDGLRAIAISWVFVMHIFYASGLPADSVNWMPRVLREVISHGWLGVDLFFLLSGFLISGILMDTRGSSSFFRKFYARRALRILPVYVVCILVMWLFYHRADAYFGLSLLFMANFAHLFKVPVPHGPSVFWSLAIEEHFYLIWPLLVFMLARAQLVALCAVIVIGTPILRGLCAYWGMDPEGEIYLYSYFRFDGLALGAILAIWIRSQYFTRNYAWKLSGVFLAAFLLITAVGWPFGVMGTKTVAATALRYTQADMVFAAAMTLALAYRNTRVTSLLRSPVAGLIASLSYCIYLIHLAMIDLYVGILSRFAVDDTASLGFIASGVTRLVIIGVATIAVAMLSNKYLEGPVLKFKRHF